MKKSLLKPPQGHCKTLFLCPDKEALCNKERQVGTAHQPYFFHPGISLKFLFLDSLTHKKKRIIFVDTDRINLSVKTPSEGRLEFVELIKSERVLFDYPLPRKEDFVCFFRRIEECLSRAAFAEREKVQANFYRFKKIILENYKCKSLKELLALSFLRYYQLNSEFSFLSEVIRVDEFYDFFAEIYHRRGEFQKAHNTALEEYKNTFRFRYKNYPFPKLEDGELPFWLVENGQRRRCFAGDINPAAVKRHTVFPRAVTLTMFLRRYKLDLFIHGLGGANYEWVQDRIIERFFRKKGAPYAILTGTFLLEGCPERDLPYFFFEPTLPEHSFDFRQ